MSCDLHKIGASVKLAKALQRRVRGKSIKVVAGATGRIIAVDRQSHALLVHFTQTGTTIIVPPQAVVGNKPKRDIVKSRKQHPPQRRLR